MDLETATRMQARIREIEDCLHDLDLGDDRAPIPSGDSVPREVEDLREERERLIQELALAAWGRKQ